MLPGASGHVFLTHIVSSELEVQERIITVSDKPRRAQQQQRDRKQPEHSRPIKRRPIGKPGMPDDESGQKRRGTDRAKGQQIRVVFQCDHRLKITELVAIEPNQPAERGRCQSKIGELEQNPSKQRHEKQVQMRQRALQSKGDALRRPPQEQTLRRGKDKPVQTPKHKVPAGPVPQAGQRPDEAIKALNEFLRPEFINRVDEIIYFNRLTEENIRGIAVLMLTDLRKAMAERGMTLTWDESVIDYLTKKGYSAAYGARNLQRLIQKDIEDAIATELVDRRRGAASQVGLTVREGAVTVIAI